MIAASCLAQDHRVWIASLHALASTTTIIRRTIVQP